MNDLLCHLSAACYLWGFLCQGGNEEVGVISAVSQRLANLLVAFGNWLFETYSSHPCRPHTSRFVYLLDEVRLVWERVVDWVYWCVGSRLGFTMSVLALS